MALAVSLVAPAAAEKKKLPAAPELMERVGGYVKAYVERARTLLSRETTRTRQLDASLSPAGASREVVSEQRVEWDSSQGGTIPTIIRELVKVNGRAPKPGDEPDCYDPKAEAPEPLSFLLPELQVEYRFFNTGRGRVDKRNTTIIEFVPTEAEKPRVTWEGKCSTIYFPFRGRFWTDESTGEVLRLEATLERSFDFEIPKEVQQPGDHVAYQTLQIWQRSVRYSPTTFTNPEETLLLPSTIRTIAVYQAGRTARLMTDQSFSNYRRFMTGATLIVK